MPQQYRKNLSTDQYHFFLTNEFSQWYPSEFTSKEGLHFVCCEQYMMYNKATLFGDKETAQKIMDAPSQKECKVYEDYKALNATFKALGREVKGFDQEIWDAHACEIVYQGNYYKFTQNPYLFDALMATGSRELVEAAHYDKVWGVGLKADNPLILDKANWQGKNWLGSTVTKLRGDLITAGFQPTRTEDNSPVVRFYDQDGQRMLYISVKELTQQWIDGAKKKGNIIPYPADPVAWVQKIIYSNVDYDKGRPYDMHDDPDIDPTMLGATIKGQGYIQNQITFFCQINQEFLSKRSSASLKNDFEDVKIEFTVEHHEITAHLRVPKRVMPKYNEFKEIITEVPAANQGELWSEIFRLLMKEGAVLHREDGPAYQETVSEPGKAPATRTDHWVNGVKKSTVVKPATPAKKM